MKAKACAWSKLLMPTKFASITNQNPQKTGMKLACQVLRASFIFAMCANKDSLKGKLFYSLFGAGKRFMAQIKKGLSQQTVICFAHQDVIASLDVTTPFVLEAHIFLHTKAIVELAIQANALKYSRSYSIETLIANTAQKPLEA